MPKIQRGGGHTTLLYRYSQILANTALITHWMKTKVKAKVNVSCLAPSPYLPLVLRKKSVRKKGEESVSSFRATECFENILPPW